IPGTDQGGDICQRFDGEAVGGGERLRRQSRGEPLLRSRQLRAAVLPLPVVHAGYQRLPLWRRLSRQPERLWPGRPVRPDYAVRWAIRSQLDLLRHHPEVAISTEAL